MEIIMKNELMTYNRAIKLAKEIYLNIDSSTGEILGEPAQLNPIQLSAIEKLCNPSADDLKMMKNVNANHPPRRGFPWSEKEDASLIIAFNKETSMSDIASSHLRSQIAILARLDKLGLIILEKTIPNYTYVKQAPCIRHN